MPIQAHLHDMKGPLSLRLIVLNIISGLFILLFTYAAVSKLADYQKFQVELGKSPMLTSFAGIVAWLVPAIEILISISLLFSRWQLRAMYASYTMMVLFTSYLITTLQFSDYVPCTCGGVLQDLTWQTHIVFNCGFIVLSIVGVLIHKQDISLTFRGSRKPV